MRLSHERTSVVVAGAWNPAIFTEAWVSSKIFSSEPVQVAFVMLPTGGLLAQFKRPTVELSVQPGRLEFKWPSAALDLEALQRAAIACLTTLPETPVQGVGVNLGFDAAEATEEALAVMSFHDAPLLERIGASTLQSLIHRQIRWESRTINFTISKLEAGGYHFDLNHHHDTSDTRLAAEVLRRGEIGQAIEASKRLLRGVYGLSEGE